MRSLGGGTWHGNGVEKAREGDVVWTFIAIK